MANNECVLLNWGKVVPLNNTNVWKCVRVSHLKMIQLENECILTTGM